MVCGIDERRGWGGGEEVGRCYWYLVRDDDDDDDAHHNIFFNSYWLGGVKQEPIWYWIMIKCVVGVVGYWVGLGCAWRGASMDNDDDESRCVIITPPHPPPPPPPPNHSVFSSSLQTPIINKTYTQDLISLWVDLLVHVNIGENVKVAQNRQTTICNRPT